MFLKQGVQWIARPHTTQMGCQLERKRCRSTLSRLPGRKHCAWVRPSRIWALLVVLSTAAAHVAGRRTTAVVQDSVSAASYQGW